MTWRCKVLGFIMTLLMGCSDPDSDSDSDSLAEDLGPEFTLKMNQATGENSFAQLAYQCDACSFEQFAAIQTPAGWTKSPTQVILPMGELRSTPSIEGVPSTMDFVSEIPGEEFELIAKTLDGSLVEMGENGIMVVVDVMRDTLFRYPEGSRVHELSAPDGTPFVLFAYEVDSEDFESPDFEAADALEAYPAPEDWTYSTRILDEELVMESNDVATVLAITGEVSSVWQQR